ncbi:hypothetical protein [Glycocaulis alkaliphilus]|uniref:hypothetical protein n=1 Tax=Glycocaulis alkaliphilus TaxID=1434191 RepID=UPI000FD8DC10|nr:hypothetical protein [Glycocaulis alkaliphilus]GGB85211.1 hypothetical protein GCM10007417_26550 [Glycocaulis alkaliphilus]
MSFVIEDGVPVPPINRGRPRDARLEQLDVLAAQDVIAGKYRNAREAAKAYLPEYAGVQHQSYDKEMRNIKLRDITDRIKSELDKALME